MVKRNKSLMRLLEKYKNGELLSLKDGAWAKASGEFDEQILSDLISQGLSEGKIESYSYDDIFE